MTEREKMVAGLLYYSNDIELKNARARAKSLCDKFNYEAKTEEERKEIIRSLFKKTGNDFHINPNFKCDYGYNISVGENFYLNYDCIILDICEVIIGDNVMIAPRVSIFTATHPTDAYIRNTSAEYGKPIIIEDGVWIGGGAIINPGVRIGKDSVVASGSVVTRNVPPNTIVAGNPARVIKYLGEKERAYWEDRYNNEFLK